MNYNKYIYYYSKFNWLIFATKLGSGSLKNGRDSNPKYRRDIVSDGQKVKSGSLLVTQCGYRKKAGKGTMVSRNYTIMAIKDGIVKFTKVKINGKYKIFVHVC